MNILFHIYTEYNIHIKRCHASYTRHEYSAILSGAHVLVPLCVCAVHPILSTLSTFVSRRNRTAHIPQENQIICLERFGNITLMVHI